LERSLKEGLWHVKVVSQRRVISHWRGLLKKGYDMLKWSPTKRVVSHWRGLSKKACDILKWSPKRGRYLIGEVSQWRLVTC
jgi:CRISPR/Cas system-associated protein endoribonuclease Cas2